MAGSSTQGLLGEVRRRLLGPILAHEDYPFMRLIGRCPALIMSDLLLTCVLMEKNPARRFQNAEQMLQAAMQDEKDVQEKVKKMMQMQGRKLEKDW